MFFFSELDGKSPFDLVVHKDNKLYRVEIKSTETRSKYNTGWEVQLKKVRSNRSENKITNFSSNQCDILVVYICPIDEIILIDSSLVKVKSSLTITDKEINLRKVGSMVQHQS